MKQGQSEFIIIKVANSLKILDAFLTGRVYLNTILLLKQIQSVCLLKAK